VAKEFSPLDKKADNKLAVMEKRNTPATTAAWKDLLILSSGFIAVLMVAVQFNAFERFAIWCGTHDVWEVGEILMAIILLPCVLALFVWRRSREFRAEVRRRQQAEESVRAGEESYRQLVESADEMIYRTDDRGCFSFFNPALSRLLKYSEAELLGLSYLQVIRPDQRRAAKHFYQRQIVERTRTSYYEFTAVCRDGQEILVSQNVQLITQHGQVAGFQAVARDITERKRSEDALRQVEEYRNLFKLANDSILIIDTANGTVLDVNDKACETYGIARNEFVGRNLNEIVEDSAAAEQQLEKLRVEGKLDQYEILQTRADGSPIYFLINTTVIEYQGRQAILSVNRDITERKLAEQEKEKLQTERDQLLEQLQLQIDVMPNAFVLTDETYLTTYWNPAAERIFGYAKEEMVGTHGHKLLVPPESQGFIEDIFDQIAAGASLSSSFSDNITKDGRRITCEWHTAPVRKADGTFVGIMSMAQDITERKHAETALRESEERYQGLVELSPDGIMIHKDGIITFVNSAGARLVGAADKTDLIGRSVYDVSQPQFHEALKVRVSRMLSGEALPTMEVKVRRFDGVEIDCEISSVPFTDGNGTAIQAVVRDITERKQAEQFLKEANQRALSDYERLVERIATLGQTLGNARDLTSIFRAFRDFATVSVPCDGMVISLYEEEKQTRRAMYCWADQKEFDPTNVVDVPVRPEGMTGRAIGSGLVVMANDFQRQLLDRPNAIMVGDCSDDHIPRSALTAPMAVMGRPIGVVEVQSYELGAYTQGHATAMRMAANLAATAVENVSLIEREKTKGEQLRQSQKMDSIGQLAGGVAHDFNNLLTAINGYSDLALRKIEEDNPLRKNIEAIKRAGVRAASLTSQLLAFSRKQVLQPKVLDLNHIVADTDKLLRRLIGEDIDLVSLAQPELGKVKADPGQIEQVIMNLVLNARDAMPRGGKITIETGHTYLDERYAGRHESIKPGHYVVLAVSDTGVGMDAETQKQIFDPFFTTKEVGKGTGLGLSMVYGIVKQSGGNIWVYSEVGKGTTFKIYLPRVDQVEEPEKSSVLAAIPQGTETVLLVEDEEMVRNLSQEILEDSGYRVVVATNGKEGLRVCQEFGEHIDLIITDVVMPEMNGREMAEQAALLRPTTKVLFMSGYTDDAIVRHGILEENMSYMQKPFLPDALALKAREVLDQPAV
jgi:PAS domain S-box-containing protein